MAPRRALLATSFAVLMAMVAACGSPGSSGPGTVDATTDTTPTTVQSEDAGDDPETLADYLGWSNDDPEAAEAQYREQEARLQEAIRLCMAEEGFDYIPVEQPPGSFAFDDTTPEEWAAEQGFGITTWVGNEDAFAGPEMDWVDPNQEIVEAMSESERNAYYEALHGSEAEQAELSTTQIDPETGEEIMYMEGYGAGCYGEASEAEYGQQTNAYEELAPELEAMYERIQADPRMIELDAEWVECMAEKGHEYESQQAMYDTMYDDFQVRLDAIVGPNGGYVDPFEGWTEEEINAFFEEKTEDEINAFFEQSQNETPDYDEEALAALQQEEKDLAVAAAQCQSGWDEVYMEVSAQYEAEFIAANQEKLDEIKSSNPGQG